MIEDVLKNNLEDPPMRDAIQLLSFGRIREHNLPKFLRVYLLCFLIPYVFPESLDQKFLVIGVFATQVTRDLIAVNNGEPLFFKQITNCGFPASYPASEPNHLHFNPKEKANARDNI